MYIKYFTSTQFDNYKFAYALNISGVKAKAVDDGVILDKEAFDKLDTALMPTWIHANRKHINSKLRTRPATNEEYRLIEEWEIEL